MHLRILTGLLSLGLGVSVGRLLRRLLERRDPGGDADPVTASGKLIAAWRALESLEPPGARLFQDPLASALAGSQAVHEALQLAQPWPGSSSDTSASRAGSSNASPGSTPRSPGTGSPVSRPAAEAAAEASGGNLSTPFASPPFRRFCFTNVGVRVWWFDAQLLAALNSAAQPRQVVVLGAGLDTRPWRLPLPPKVHWYEIDLPEVVAAKRQLLDQLGADLVPAGHSTLSTRSSSSTGSSAAGTAGTAPADAAHPLRAASWAALPADLGRPGWSAGLQQLGFDPHKPTVFVAEGLLMYLTEQQVLSLLGEAAAASPPGSTIIAHQTTLELLALIQSGSSAAAYAPFPPELVATWRSGFPLASQQLQLAALLEPAGWWLTGAASRAGIAAQVCAQWAQSGNHSSGGGASGSGGDAGSGSRGAGGNGSSGSSSNDGSSKQVVPSPSVDEVSARCDFEARPGVGRDRWAVFFTATRS